MGENPWENTLGRGWGFCSESVYGAEGVHAERQVDFVNMFTGLSQQPTPRVVGHAFLRRRVSVGLYGSPVGSGPGIGGAETGRVPCGQSV